MHHIPLPLIILPAFLLEISFNLREETSSMIFSLSKQYVASCIPAFSICKKFIVFFIICLTTSFKKVSAEGHAIDSLKKILPSLHDTVRIDCFIELSAQYVRDNNEDSALYYVNAAYEESRKLNNIRGIAASFYTRASIQIYLKNNVHKAVELLKESLKWYAVSKNKKDIERPYWRLGNLLGGMNKYDEATWNLKQSYTWAKKNGNTEWMQKALGVMYENFRDKGDYDKALEAFSQIQQLNIKLNGKADTFFQSYVFAELNRRIENYPAALNYYRSAIKSVDLAHADIWFRVSYPELFALNGKFDTAAYYYNLIDTSKGSLLEKRFFLVSKGEFYLLQKKYSDALQCLLPALKYNRNANDLIDTKRALLDLARTYDGLHKNSTALEYAREALAMSLGSNTSQYTRDAYYLIYSIYERKQRADSANLYYRKYIVQKELVSGEQISEKLAAYNYEQRISLLNKEREMQHAKLDNEILQKRVLIGGFIALFILAGFVLGIIILKRRNEKQALSHLIEVQKLEGEKATARLQEQKTALEIKALRAQMNPHFIFNCLNSINRFIINSDAAKAADYLTKFAKLIRIVLEQSGKPFVPLEDELKCLQFYMDLEALRFEIPFQYEINCNGTDTSAIMIPTLLIQPFVENAIWHGLQGKAHNNGKINISMHVRDNLLHCKIFDNGIGRAAIATKEKTGLENKSLGINLTQHRLELIDSSVQNGPGIEIYDLANEEGYASGTCVYIKIPVKEM